MIKEQKKQAIIDFFAYWTKGDATNASSFLDDEVLWTPMGTKGELPISGKMDKEGVLNLIKAVKEIIPEGLELTATGWTIEENRVAVEIESYGVIKENGKVYNNLYHFLIEFKNNKIIRVKEYMDTLHVKEIFIDN